MNAELAAGRWVIGNVFTNYGWSGHSIVIQSYNTKKGEYTYWDPWINNSGQFSSTDLLNNTIQLSDDNWHRTLAWVQYCR